MREEAEIIPKSGIPEKIQSASLPARVGGIWGKLGGGLSLHNKAWEVMMMKISILPLNALIRR